ncbi:MAG TPA: SRPBCC family protein [Xanthomonadaceae bacterium]|nr:SRPBCC family protein [Xanthomonadaceae bacterium]
MKLTVEALARTDLKTAWSAYNTPDDITQWNTPDPSWHSPRSQVDLREGGKFNTRMEAKDGSMGFDFEGTYTNVVPNEVVEYRMGDGREAIVRFSEEPEGTRVRVDFDPESENPIEMQQAGWQAILDNFARYVEGKSAAR